MNEMRATRERAAEVGLLLGTVFAIVVIAYGNRGIWMPGILVLAIGFWTGFEGAT